MATVSSSNLPIFSPNQILRAEDLNALVDFMDRQIRLSRTSLIGIGILSGLVVEYEPNPPQGEAPYIKITAGTGISSDGYLFDC